jgi:hypothetical protein
MREISREEVVRNWIRTNWDGEPFYLPGKVSDKGKLYAFRPDERQLIAEHELGLN